MLLTRAEVLRARSLQRRLKILRFWFRIGKVLYWPWSSLQKTWDKWYFELKILRDKMILNTPPSKRIVPDARYDAKEIRGACEMAEKSLKEMLGILNSMEGQTK